MSKNVSFLSSDSKSERVCLISQRELAKNELAFGKLAAIMMPKVQRTTFVWYVYKADTDFGKLCSDQTKPKVSIHGCPAFEKDINKAKQQANRRQQRQQQQQQTKNKEEEEEERGNADV